MREKGEMLDAALRWVKRDGGLVYTQGSWPLLEQTGFRKREGFTDKEQKLQRRCWELDVE